MNYVKCNYCNKIFTNVKIRKHLESKHNKTLENNSNLRFYGKEFITDDDHKCPICGNLTNNRRGQKFCSKSCQISNQQHELYLKGIHPSQLGKVGCKRGSESAHLRSIKIHETMRKNGTIHWFSRESKLRFNENGEDLFYKNDKNQSYGWRNAKIRKESKAELEIYNYIKNKYNKTVKNKIIGDLNKLKLHHPFDIYIPELNLLIEYDGDYWHHKRFNLKLNEFTRKDINLTILAKFFGYNIERIPEYKFRKQNFKLIDEILMKYKSLN